jgi:hypothetical protein
MAIQFLGVWHGFRVFRRCILPPSSGFRPHYILFLPIPAVCLTLFNVIGTKCTFLLETAKSCKTGCRQTPAPQSGLGWWVPCSQPSPIPDPWTITFRLLSVGNKSTGFNLWGTHDLITRLSSRFSHPPPLLPLPFVAVRVEWRTGIWQRS